jgi:hypothetical protein
MGRSDESGGTVFNDCSVERIENVASNNPLNTLCTKVSEAWDVVGVASLMGAAGVGEPFQVDDLE